MHQQNFILKTGILEISKLGKLESIRTWRGQLQSTATNRLQTRPSFYLFWSAHHSDVDHSRIVRVLPRLSNPERIAAQSNFTNDAFGLIYINSNTGPFPSKSSLKATLCGGVARRGPNSIGTCYATPMSFTFGGEMLTTKSKKVGFFCLPFGRETKSLAKKK